jgi:AraC family transcriptional regulator of adaptative response / DNA-3-methyladenine glycosylase II
MLNQQYQQARMTRDPRFDGQFFVAVKTTKIFCRSICPANSPKEHNVEYFELAQQAMLSGYRPCLRCRPDSAPKSFAWKGVDTTVERAQKLLTENWKISIQEIADKLGVSDRYFRQLFQKKLGLSPKQYQLFDQLLFAKQLLHQSAMPVDDVALACGFASARRLQDNLKRVSGLTPKQMRTSAITNTKTIQLNLAFRPPYDWQHLLDFLALRAIKGIEEVTNTSYSRSFITDGNRGWFCAHYVESKNHFSVEIKLEKIDSLKQVVDNIRRVLDLDADVNTIQQQLMNTGLNNVQSGMRLPGVWSTFEAGCRAILGQQISVSAAIKLVTLLAEKIGDTQKEVDELTYYFPSAEQVANSDLLFLKIPASRRNTLRDFAIFYSLAEEDDPGTWLQIKGIGPWTVAYAKMRGLSHPDIWLKTDLVIKKQLEHMAVDADKAIPWRSYLTFQIWNDA